MLEDSPLTKDSSDGRFSGNFWNKEGLEVVETFFNERNESMQCIMRFMSEMAKREEEFVWGIEKLIKKMEKIKEGESVQEVWKTFTEQLEINIKILTERISKIRTEICLQLEVFDAEYTRIVKKDFAELKKLYSEYGLMQSNLIKARGKYNQASQLADMTGKHLKNSQGDPKLISRLEKEKLKCDKAAKLSEDAYKDAVEKLTNFHPQYTKKLITIYDDLQTQELSRTAIVARCFRFYVDFHRAGENWVINMRKEMLNVIKNVNTQSDMNNWIEKNRKGLHPPDLPVFHPFNGEPEKPTAPKPSHRLSIITERERKASQTRSAEASSRIPEKVEKSEKMEKSEKKSFGMAFVKGKTDRGNAGLPFTLGQRLSKVRNRVEQQTQTEAKQVSETSSIQDTKRVSFDLQNEIKKVDLNETEKVQDEEKEETRRDTLEATIIAQLEQETEKVQDEEKEETTLVHLEQELISTDEVQNTNKDSKPDIISEFFRDTVEVSEEAPTLGWVRVIFDYEAAGDDELPLQQGEIIRLLDMHESGWWTGDLNGVIGLFPGNHVEMNYGGQ